LTISVENCQVLVKIKLFIFLILFIIVACSERRDQQITSKRIISLAPHISEIIYAIGAEEELVAVTDFCRYPNEVMNKEKIGGLLNPNIERMLRLRPTHLFGVPAHESLNQELQKFGLSVFMLPNETIADVLYSIERVGEETGHEDGAKHLITNIGDSLAILKAELRSLRAMLIIGREKGTLRNVTVTGSNTFIDEMWQLVGGQNIFSDLPSRYGNITLEEILRRNPDIIIEFDVDGERGVITQDPAREWEIFKNVKAIRNKNLFLIRGTHTLIPGPRMVLLAEDFSQVISLASENL
jgi:iron complex transport system substrate-binding protein